MNSQDPPAASNDPMTSNAGAQSPAQVNFEWNTGKGEASIAIDQIAQMRFYFDILRKFDWASESLFFVYM